MIKFIKIIKSNISDKEYKGYIYDHTDNKGIEYYTENSVWAEDTYTKREIDIIERIYDVGLEEIGHFEWNAYDFVKKLSDMFDNGQIVRKTDYNPADYDSPVEWTLDDEDYDFFVNVIEEYLNK